MGVASFFKWLVKKYPNAVVNAIEAKGDLIDTCEPNPNGMEFDNLYLDMNEIIHPCFHPEDHPFPPTTFDEVFKSIFQYIDRLFGIVRPRKLLYMAIDGVAPRAKMNQQRSRRFRTAKDAETAEAEEERLRREFEMEGKKVLPKVESEVSDYNIVTPGTEFMEKLSKALQYHIRLRLNSDPGWKKITVILSDANVPGEGEHKIMKFIRLQRNLRGFDPNTRHCFYGQDADLIMLALATHEVHFSILREDVQAQWPICTLSRETSRSKVESVLVKSRGWFVNVKAINGGVSLAKQPIQFLNIWTLREYLELDLKISDPPFEIDLERIIDDFIFICFFAGNDFLPNLPSLAIHEGAIDLLMTVYRDEFKSRGGYLVDMHRVDDKNAGYVELKRIEKFIHAVGMYEGQIFKKRLNLWQHKINSFLRENAKDVADLDTKQEDPVFQSPIGNLKLNSKNSCWGALDEKVSTSCGIANNIDDCDVLTNTKEFKRRLKDFIHEKSDIFKQGILERDKVRLGMKGWRERYYKEKFSAESPDEIERIRKEIVEKYTEGLCWVLQYYFFGVRSWTWYYPYHYGPFASDLKGLAGVKVRFSMDAAFKPFDQLMGVLPPRSVTALPEVYWHLMTSEQSKIIDFYPTDFEVDIDGKRYMWQGIVKLPFIMEERLLSETKKLENELKEDEVKRNSESMDKMFVTRSHDLGSQVLSLYSKHISENEQRKIREAIDIHSSGRINGFIRPCDDDSSLANSVFCVTGMEDILKDDVMCVIYECPDSHPHIPCPPEKVTIPEKTITEANIGKTRLWHEYEGPTPTNSLHTQERYKKVVTPDSSFAREIYIAAGSGWSAGRGKVCPETSTSGLNFEFSRGIHSATGGKFTSSGSSSADGKWGSGSGSGQNSEYSRQIEAVSRGKIASPGQSSSAGRGWTGAASNRGNWRRNGSSGISNSGRGSASSGGIRAGNSGFLPPRNVSTVDRSYTWQHDSSSTHRSRGRGRFEPSTSVPRWIPKRTVTE